MKRDFDPNQLGEFEDWEGNNIAFHCPRCNKLYIVSEQIHRGERICPNPNCGKSKGVVRGGKKSGGTAYIVWD